MVIDFLTFASYFSFLQEFRISDIISDIRVEDISCPS